MDGRSFQMFLGGETPIDVRALLCGSVAGELTFSVNVQEDPFDETFTIPMPEGLPHSAT